MNWISAKDKLPPFNHEVLYVAITDTGTREMMTGHLGAQGWTHCCMFYSTMHLNESVIVTHWMELPEFPDPHPLANVIDAKAWASKFCEENKDLLKRLADR